MSDNFKKCLADGCDRSASRSDNGKMGYCSMHYQRWKKHGDPRIVKAVASPAKDWIDKHKDYKGDDCLTWPFHIGADGYGRVHRPNDGPLTTASNLMCEAAHGPAPSSKHESAHSCGRGNRGCMNPNHLYWATPSRNHADKIIHGTTNRGERHGAHKLTSDEVRQIRRYAKSAAFPQTEIAEMFGVSQTHVSAINVRKAWAWLD